MKYEDVVEIERLASEVARLKILIEAHHMQNISTLSSAERQNAFIEMQLADAQLAMAEGALSRAKGQMYLYGHLRK